MFTEVNHQYIIDENGDKLSVILSIHDYENMLNKLEDIEDIRLFDESKKNDQGERIPMNEVFEMIELKRNSTE